MTYMVGGKQYVAIGGPPEFFALGWGSSRTRRHHSPGSEKRLSNIAGPCSLSVGADLRARQISNIPAKMPCYA
jgi:hypothetical protein